jgi:predicted phage baseplate assembly protein
MSDADGTLRGLDDCGCCDGVAVETPSVVYNRPGLTALAYRVGTHAQFKESLLARLSASRQPALYALNTRDDDDFSIALLDAWSTVADVLTFYQERIANESYLRTATERRSLLEMARLIGYELRPGVAASVYLVFMLEDPPGATRRTATSLGVPRSTTIDAGVKVQSIPGPGEQAQTFETVEKIEARTEWNVIKPRLTRRHPIARNADVLFFAGLATGLKKGDGLLIAPDDGSDLVFRQVAEVSPNDARQRTEVRFQPLPRVPRFHDAIGGTAVLLASSPGPVTQRFLNRTINASDLRTTALADGFAVADLFDNLTAVKRPPPSVLAFRARAAIFGHNAPRFSALSIGQSVGEAIQTSATDFALKEGAYKGRKDDWVENTLDRYPDPPPRQDPFNSTNIYLDGVYPAIVKDSFVALKDGTDAQPYEVRETAEVSKADFTLSAKVTRLTLDRRAGFEEFSIRNTTVFAQSEQLALARLPIEEPVAGRTIDLDTFVDGLFPGQKTIVCGELDAVRGVSACELALIEQVDQVLETEGFTRVTLSVPLGSAYVRDTVTINANIALATHGETVQGTPGRGEVLGNGDASQVFQRFTLREPPLTYTSAATPSGAQTTLEVRVDDLLWHEVPSFYGHGPDERIYVTRTDDDGKTAVVFGDGKTGTRLPTGEENVTATYRKGIGRPGLVKANQLSQLMTRPLGVRAATNPMAPGGAADPEALADARRNAPLTVLTLGRIVSLDDYEDFARAFAGVGKALATWTWSGQQRVVFVTVAGANGADIASDSPLYEHLLNAMREAGDPTVALLVGSYVPAFLRLAAAVKVDPDYAAPKVLAAVEQQLRESFSFEARQFGQAVNLSEAISAMHRVRGVVAVDVNGFFRGETPGVNARVDARGPRQRGGELVAAELLTLDPRPLDLEVLP